MVDLDVPIDEAKTRGEDLRASMGPVREAFVRAAGVHGQSWIAEKIPTIVRTDPARAKDLGIETLRRMKEETAELESSIPAAVAAALSDTAIWSDLQNPPKRQRYVNALSEIDDVLLVPWRESLKSADELVGRYSFDATELAMARKGWSSSSKDTLRPSTEMIRLANEYAKLDRQLFEARSDLHKALRAKEEAEAADLWDQA